MKKKNIYLFFLILILIVAIIAILDKPSNQYSQFKGNTEIFHLNSQNSNLNFNATSNTYINTNYTQFYYVKNIQIEGNKNSEEKSINESRSLIIQFNNQGNIKLSNVFGNFLFNNLTITNSFDDGMILQGDLNENSPSFLYPNDIDFLLINGAFIDYVMVDDEKFTDFKQIFFEMDNKSYIQFSSGNINLKSFGINYLRILGKPSKIGITQSEGMLRLDGHQFFIQSADSLEIEILKSEESVLNIKDKTVEFAGVTNSSKLNDESIIMNDFFYWYKIKPETLFSGINAFAVVFLVILTAWYAHQVYEQTNLVVKSNKRNIILDYIQNFLWPISKQLKSEISNIERNEFYWCQSNGKSQLNFINKLQNIRTGEDFSKNDVFREHPHLEKLLFERDKLLDELIEVYEIIKETFEKTIQINFLKDLIEQFNRSQKEELKLKGEAIDNPFKHFMPYLINYESSTKYQFFYDGPSSTFLKEFGDKIVNCIEKTKLNELNEAKETKLKQLIEKNRKTSERIHQIIADYRKEYYISENEIDRININ